MAKDMIGEGTFYDGAAPVGAPVAVRLSKRMLVIENAAVGAPAEWPLGKLRRAADEPDDLVRLSVKGTPDHRLVLKPGPLAEALQEAAPRTRAATFSLLKSGPPAALAAAVSAVAVWGLLAGAPKLARPVALATPDAIETRIGLQTYRAVARDWPECETPTAAKDAIDALVDELRLEGFDDPVAVELVETRLPNAFALPGGIVLVTGALIAEMQSPDEFAGVLAHEMGHVRESHGMQIMVSRMSLAMATSLFSGGLDLLAMSATELATLRYSRDFERAADAYAVEALGEAGVATDGLADLFDRLSAKQAADVGAPAWLSTHPEDAERAAAARAGGGAAKRPALSEENWALVKDACPVPQPEVVADDDADGDVERDDEAAEDAETSAAETAPVPD